MVSKWDSKVINGTGLSVYDLRWAVGGGWNAEFRMPPLVTIQKQSSVYERRRVGNIQCMGCSINVVYMYQKST